MSWGAAIGSIVSAGIGFLGAKQQNKAASAQALRQMEFQERMASTQYQRAVKDMRAAGLNPILALGKPAAAPGGAAAPVVNQFGNIGGAVNSAIAARRLAADIDVLEAQAQNTRADTVKKQAETRVSQGMADKVLADTGLVQAQQDRAAFGIKIDRQTLSNLLSIGRKLGHEVATAQHMAKLRKYEAAIRGGQALRAAQVQELVNEIPWLGLVLGAMETSGGSATIKGAMALGTGVTERLLRKPVKGK